MIHIDNSSAKKSQDKLIKYMFKIDSKGMNNYKPMTSQSIKDKFYLLKKEIGSLTGSLLNTLKVWEWWWPSSNSSNSPEQQLLTKRFEELYELKEKMEAGKLVNKNLEERDSKLSELISKFKDRLDEDEKEVLDELLNVQKKIAKSGLEGCLKEEELEFKTKLGTLKRKLSGDKLSKKEINELLDEKEFITRSLILSEELEINERKQLQQEIIKYSAMIGLNDIRNKSIKDLLFEKSLLEKFELKNDDDSISDENDTDSIFEKNDTDFISSVNFEEIKKIDLIMKIGEENLKLKQLKENTGFNKETQILLKMLLSAQERVLRKVDIVSKQEKNELQQKLIKKGSFHKLIKILNQNEKIIKLKFQVNQIYEQKKSPFKSYLNLQQYLDKLYPTKKSKKEVKEIIIDFYENPIEAVGGGILDLHEYYNLKELIIDGDYLKSKLTELNVSGCSNLELLHCTENELNFLNLTNNKKLTKLTLAYNQLNNISFLKNISYPNKFVHLDIFNNRIRENNLEFLKSFVNLESLSLGNYREGFFNNFTGPLESLKKLTKLKKLDIKDSGIDTDEVKKLFKQKIYIG